MKTLGYDPNRGSWTTEQRKGKGNRNLKSQNSYFLTPLQQAGEATITG